MWTGQAARAAALIDHRSSGLARKEKREKERGGGGFSRLIKRSIEELLKRVFVEKGSRERLSWCFEPSQPLWIISGLGILS